MKTKTIPFDLETAKKIQAGEIEGKIKTRTNKDVRIICWDRMDTEIPIVLLVQYDSWESLHECNSIGEYTEGYGDDARLNKLVLEVTDNEPQFKPFDKVLVRNDVNSIWQPSIFTYQLGDSFYTVSLYPYKKEHIIPYEGNEHLVGTIDNLKEE